MIDLHSHLLPGVDDGSRTVAQSVEVLTRLARQGVTAICLTPHLLASQALDGMPAAYDRAFESLQPMAPGGIRLYRGAEVMLDRPLGVAVARDRVVTINRSRYLLVEFPRLVAAQTVEHALALVVTVGLVPLLAHPERYRACQLATVARWRSLGALMQVDGPTMLSPRPRGERARELVAHGFADIIAADNHGDARSLAEARSALFDQGGGIQAEMLSVRNPAAILADQPVEPMAPFTWRLSFLKRLRGLLMKDQGDRP
ncbi:MAG: CpsB/CapC family capsule biosynthesis tyrosine phosphatase [Gemmatimonadales bacterium]